jgi:hypothetical protein
MEPESSSPYPQVPANCPYPEPTPSSPHDPLQLPEDLRLQSQLGAEDWVSIEDRFRYFFRPTLESIQISTHCIL